MHATHTQNDSYFNGYVVMGYVDYESWRADG